MQANIGPSCTVNMRCENGRAYFASPKDLSRNNMNNLAPRFGSDLDGTIEKKPRHSPAMLRFFRLRRVQKWPEDRMRDGHVISWQVLRDEEIRHEGEEGNGNGCEWTISNPSLSFLTFYFSRLTNFKRRNSTFPLFWKRKGRECTEIRKFTDVE